MKYELLDYEKIWLDFINNDNIKKIIDEGKQEEYIGAKIFIRNKLTPGYYGWQIADFGHDNSGYTVDLISTNNVCNGPFNDDNTNNYITSDIKIWLNGAYYIGFSDDIRSKMDTMTVVTNTPSGLVISNDKVKLLSCTELNLSSYHDGMPRNEGNPYPIFPSCQYNDIVDERAQFGLDCYWLRSRYFESINSVWQVFPDGGLVTGGNTNDSNDIVPVIRFKNI